MRIILFRSAVMLTVAFLYSKACLSARATPSSPLGSTTTRGINTIASYSSSSAKASSVLTSPHRLRVVQVHVVHRHGDRSPITSLKNESFWASELVKEELANRVASTTTIIRDGESGSFQHVAGGRGPFGKLTQLGLLQMVQVGSTLRSELVLENDDGADENGVVGGHVHEQKGRLFAPANPLHVSKIKVWSTDFPRTIQSVQGTLMGLFPEPIQEPVPVDVRHTNIMIPDPQPRQTLEQADLELRLSRRPHFVARELEMKGLAREATQSLRHLLSDDAFTVSFGVGEENQGAKDEQQPTLSWAQLSEITKCLQTRDLLPKAITAEMQEQISQHTAWRWFESLRHPRLAYLAMNSFVTNILEAMHKHVVDHKKERGVSVPLLHLYSAHDSSLIGLLCAFRLEQPAKWPEYGSYFKMELVEATPMIDAMTTTPRFLVRFSLNGEILRSKWENCEISDEPLDMIPLETLSKYVKQKGGGGGAKEKS